MKRIRVFLADDHTLVRAGIRSLLEVQPDIEVIGESGDGSEALRLIQDLHPDVVLMDIGMPGLSGLEVMKRLRATDDAVRVLILSMHSAEEYVVQALHGGAAGYLLKGSSAAELEVAVRAVAKGETYLSPAVSRSVVDDYVRRTASPPDPLGMLTPRQRQILQLVAERNSSKDIAQKLELSFKTVEAHRAQIMERLDIHDLAGLVLFAVRVGLVTPGA